VRVSKSWTPAKPTVELRPSRIRRDPPRPAKIVEPVSTERETWFGVLGITLFALAITSIIIGFSAWVLQSEAPAASAPEARFGRCGADLEPDCVIDGDTVRMSGATIAIAGMVVPRLNDARCTAEEDRGAAAVEGLVKLLNGGVVTSGTSVVGADGKPRTTVLVDGQDVAAAMIAQHLARPDGGSDDWCEAS
jgi:endonuclease YncB( thermonuclease family)